MAKLTRREVIDALRKSNNALNEYAACPSEETIAAIMGHLQLVTMALATHMEIDHDSDRD